MTPRCRPRPPPRPWPIPPPLVWLHAAVPRPQPKRRASVRHSLTASAAHDTCRAMHEAHRRERCRAHAGDPSAVGPARGADGGSGGRWAWLTVACPFVTLPASLRLFRWRRLDAAWCHSHGRACVGAGAGRGSGLRLRLRLLRCLPKRLTAVAHRRAEFLRPSPSVPIRGLRCGGAYGRARGEVGWGEREG